MVAKLKPMGTHISMKTGRLLGTQATMLTAGMKSWERAKVILRNSESAKPPLPYRESDENCGLLSDSQQKRLPQRDGRRGCTLEGVKRVFNQQQHLLGRWRLRLTSKPSSRYWYWAPSLATWLQKSAKFPKDIYKHSHFRGFPEEKRVI